jgi:hypothetical protein
MWNQKFGASEALRRNSGRYSRPHSSQSWHADIPRSGRPDLTQKELTQKELGSRVGSGLRRC